MTLLKWLGPITALYVASLGFPSGAQLVYTEPVVLNTQQWPPFEWERNGEQGGFAIEMVRCVFSKLGRPVEFQFLPWKRAQVDVQNGIADGFFPASQSADRDVYAVRSVPIISVDWVWFTKKDSKWDVLSPEFKMNAYVTAQQGSYYGVWLSQNGYKVDLYPNTHLQMTGMLQRDRLDAFLANDMVVGEELKGTEYSLNDFRMLTIKSDPLGVYFSKSFLQAKPDFIEKFNAVVPQCRAD